MTAVTVRAAEAADRVRVAEFLEDRGMRPIARLGELHDPLDGKALIAESDAGDLVGVLTWWRDDTGVEVTTLYVASQWHGIGSELVSAVEREARVIGARRLWLVTTNDNVDALRFYQRRGFRLAELHPGAVDDSRARLKLSISETGDHGIPIHDELVLERVLSAAGGTS